VRPRRSAAGNLPAELTSFVGRRRHLAEVRDLLQATRLLTITGPGGAGKTRLALKTAAALSRAFPDGVWLVELAELEDPTMLAAAVARALDLRDQSGRWPLAALVEHVAAREQLLVLDNCEHHIDACAVLVDTLLRASPGLRILATSRQALGVDGEVAYPVSPLAIAEEAVPLFAERAASVRRCRRHRTPLTRRTAKAPMMAQSPATA
jgi:predicted ATPase